MPFREAHEMVGRIVIFAIESGRELNELPLDQFKTYSTLIEDDVFNALSLENTLASKSQTGGTAAERVIAALAAARKDLAAN
jgi:argininosuccinate lyase